ncbi:AraC family transcriptional regulator [Desulfatibacillum aliphaticivorans]|uniref:AraC family transcriptional regulator n=1 Tax=Desulfatibacillum aliphaticivorans TaxID=218208 RepID=UPI0003FF510A|nr:AraC family transcriptional regulator [Desulfatibacillum aliphaticivorans]
MNQFLATHPTTISSWAVVIARTCAFYGLNSKELLKKAAIDEKVLGQPGQRIEIDKIARLWNLAVEQSRDPCLGLRVIRHIHPVTFHALGPALLASRDLREALERLCRVYQIISDEVEVRIDSRDDGDALCFTPFAGRPLPVGASVDAFMAAAVFYARMLYDASLNPVKVEFMHEKWGEGREYERLFQAPVYFAMQDNAIVFSLQDAHKTLLTANAEIAMQNDKLVFDYLARCKTERLDQQVRSRLLKSLPLGEPSIETTAQSMGISPRSLQRHLRNQGTSFTEILDETRKHLAENLIRYPHLSVTDVAFQLGYSDSSNFSRAFRRWFGKSPNMYKRIL